MKRKVHVTKETGQHLDVHAETAGLTLHVTTVDGDVTRTTITKAGGLDRVLQLHGHDQWENLCSAIAAVRLQLEAR